MNSVILIGRLTKEPKCRYTPSGMAVLDMTVAIDRLTKEGEQKKTDFPKVIVYGRQAENAERFLFKGALVGVSGKITTGSYKDKNGNTVYTTEVTADRVEYLEHKPREAEPEPEPKPEPTPPDYSQIREDIPF